MAATNQSAPVDVKLKSVAEWLFLLGPAGDHGPCRGAGTVRLTTSPTVPSPLGPPVRQATFDAIPGPPMYDPLSFMVHRVYAFSRPADSPGRDGDRPEARYGRSRGEGHQSSPRWQRRPHRRDRPRHSSRACPARGDPVRQPARPRPHPRPRRQARRQPPRAYLGGRARRALERLALAAQQPRQHRRGDRPSPQPHRRRACRALLSGQVPGRHHTLLPEPDRPRRSERRSAGRSSPPTASTKPSPR